VLLRSGVRGQRHGDNRDLLIDVLGRSHSISGMRIMGLAFISVILIIVVGCAAKKPVAPPPAAPAVFSPVPGVAAGPTNAVAPAQPLTLTPETGLNGKIISVDNSARFVVVSFPGGQLPPHERKFNIYRQGLKVGEIKISGPQLNQNIAADLTDGEAQAGDDVREN